jgi:hypothetical protein
MREESVLQESSLHKVDKAKVLCHIDNFTYIEMIYLLSLERMHDIEPLLPPNNPLRPKIPLDIGSHIVL